MPRLERTARHTRHPREKEIGKGGQATRVDELRLVACLTAGGGKPGEAAGGHRGGAEWCHQFTGRAPPRNRATDGSGGIPDNPDEVL